MNSVLALALLTPFGRAAIDSGAPAAHASRTIGGGSLLVQLRPLVGLPEGAVVAAVIRGPRAAKIRRLTPGVPARLPYSSPEGSLVVLVTEKRSGEANELGEPIAILEQACSDSAPIPPAPASPHPQYGTLPSSSATATDATRPPFAYSPWRRWRMAPPPTW